MAPTNWDSEAHLSLLQAVIRLAPPTAQEWDDIIKEVSSKGYVYTSSAAL